ncbi:cadherin-like domain-containing protein [Lacibacterium aquatile]|uniref:Cadherin-like domain-containing protein n=1 Tax=Lacibacterium aquatile TaxID=1168082 RepID=A0ABW5DY96_9PROT
MPTVAEVTEFGVKVLNGSKAELSTFIGTFHHEADGTEWIDGRVLMDLNIPGQEPKPYKPKIDKVTAADITADKAYVAPVVALDTGWELQAGHTFDIGLIGQGATVGAVDAASGVLAGTSRTTASLTATTAADTTASGGGAGGGGVLGGSGPNLILPPANVLPTAGADTLAATEDSALILSAADLLANDGDADGGTLTVNGVGTAVGGTVVLMPDGTISFTPRPDFFGTASFTYTVSDGQGGVTTAVATLQVANVADVPVARKDTVQTAEDTVLVLDPATLLKNDSDADGTSPTLTAVFDAVGGTVELVGGKVVFIPDADFTGLASFSYTISDSEGGTATASVTVAVAGVGDVPVLGADAAQMDEDGTLILQPADLLANDSDADGDTLTIVGVESLSGGTAVLLPDGTISFTPAPDFNGPAVLRYLVSDGSGHLAQADIAVAVAPVNDAPVAADDTADAVEDTPLLLKAADLLANDSDVDGDTLTIVGAEALSGGTASISAEGDILFTPDADFFGQAQLTYKIADGAGGFSTATVTLTVEGTDDAPVAFGETLALTEDTNALISAATLLANDIDVDGDSLKIVGIAGSTGGKASLNADGDITFTPTANLNGKGAASITYIVEDPSGRQSEATATIDIAAVNDAPTVTGEIYGTHYQGTGAFEVPVADLLANDSDVDGDTLTISAVGTPVGGTVTLDGGKVIFTPTPDFTGQAGFTYTVDDGNGGTTKATVAFEVQKNTAPTAVGETLTGSAEDAVRTISFADLLKNDTDFEEHALSIVGVQAVEGANVELTDTGVKITPLPNYNGVVKFNYLVEDKLGAQSTAQASFTLTAVNDAPVAANETIAATEDTKVVMTFKQLLGNDVDVEGDALTITAVSGATKGSVVMDKGAGTVTFTLDQNYNGSAAGFTYTVSDGKGGTDTAKVTLNVAAVNDAPTVKGELLAGVEDTVYKVKLSSLLSNDSDVDGDSLTIASVKAGTGVDTVVISGGYVVMTPDKDYDGNASFQYRVSDGNGGFTWSTVVVALAGVDDGPTNSSKSYNGEDGQTLKGTVPVSDVDGGDYSYQVVSTTESGQWYWKGTNNPVTGISSWSYAQPPLAISGSGGFTWAASHMHSWHEGGDSSYEQGTFVFVGTATYKIKVTDENGEFAYTTLTFKNEGNPPIADTGSGDDHGYDGGTPPIILDLDKDGEIIANAEKSGVTFDWNGDGKASKTAWVDQGDGFLMLDRNGDGKAQSEDIIFANDHPDAQTDMDGVRLAYDSNKNGKLDAGDEKFADFKVWQDLNQDGISQAEEIKTLAEHGISSIGLEAPRIDSKIDGGALHRETEVTFEDGSTTKAGDVTIHHQDGPTISVEQQAALLIEAMAAFVPETLDQVPLTQSQPLPDWLPRAEEEWQPM